MNESDIETPVEEAQAPKQSSFEIKEGNFNIITQDPKTNHSEEISPIAKEEAEKVVDKDYRPYCGEGHGKMIPSKFGGFWCPKCRGR